jgi:hypothetical protein
MGAMEMTDKQQPPERIWIDESGKDSSFWDDNGDAIGTIPYARVHQIDDERLKQIRWRAEIDGYRKLTLGDGNTSLALVQARADVMDLLSLLPQLSSSGPCVCGHAKSRHESFSDHEECLGCCGLDDPCSEYRGSAPSVSSSERRCGECGRDHVAEMRRALTGIFDYTGNDIQAIKNTAYRAIPNTKCQSAIECVFPATGAARDLGLDTNFPLSETLRLMVEWMQHLHESHNCDCHGWEQRSFLIEAAERYQREIATTGAAEGGQQLTEVAATATADEEDSTTTPNNAVREDLKALVQLLVEDVSEYFLDTDPKVDFTRLPNIIRMRLSRHFPPIEAAQPAGVEGGAVAWLLPQIKRRLQTVLDCENSMCTHCCEVLAGDLAPMIDRAIELCATPAPAESEEAEPLNGSEDSWMTL